MRPKAAGYCIALAELSSHTGQTESHMQWSYIPMEPQHPSPGRTAFNAANKHNHHVLISSLEAPAASAPAAANWSESMIQQKNSSCRAQLSLSGLLWRGKGSGLAAMGTALYQDSKPAKQRAPALPHVLLHQGNLRVNPC